MATTPRVHAFVSNVPSGRHETANQAPRCPTSLWSGESAAVENFQKYWEEEHTFETLVRVTIHNGTCAGEKLLGIFPNPRSRPITRPSSHLRTLIRDYNGKVYCSAWYRNEEHDNQRQCFVMAASRNAGNITLSIVATNGFSCDAIELTSLSGPLGRFSNPSGDKYKSHLQLLNGDSSSKDGDSRDTVVIKSEKNKRLAYKQGDVTVEAKLDHLYDPLREEAFDDELAKLGRELFEDAQIRASMSLLTVLKWFSSKDAEERAQWSKLTDTFTGTRAGPENSKLRALKYVLTGLGLFFSKDAEEGSLWSKWTDSLQRAASEDLANMTSEDLANMAWEIRKLMYAPSIRNAKEVVRVTAKMDELRSKWG